MANIWDVTNPLKPSALADKDSVLDYPQSWAQWLADIADTIASIRIIPNAPESGSPPSIVASFHAAGVVTAFIDFRLCDLVKQSVTYEVTTASTPPRIDQRTFYFKLKQR